MREEEGRGDLTGVLHRVCQSVCACVWCQSVCAWVHVSFVSVCISSIRIYMLMSMWMYNTGCINHPAMLSHLIGRDVCKLHKLALWICWRAGGVMLSTCVCVCVCVCVSVGARVCMSQRGVRAAWCLYHSIAQRPTPVMYSASVQTRVNV